MDRHVSLVAFRRVSQGPRPAWVLTRRAPSRGPGNRLPPRGGLAVFTRTPRIQLLGLPASRAQLRPESQACLSAGPHPAPALSPRLTSSASSPCRDAGLREAGWPSLGPLPGHQCGAQNRLSKQAWPWAGISGCCLLPPAPTPTPDLAFFPSQRFTPGPNTTFPPKEPDEWRRGRADKPWA